MSLNLLQNIQENLGYPPLQKIDPNLQDIATDPTTPNENRLAQAAIPSALLALYKYIKTDEGADAVKRENYSPNWVDLVFGDVKEEAVNRIAAYAHYQNNIVEEHLATILNEAVRLFREQKAVNAEANTENVEQMIATERNNILPYLPASLNMGELFGDTTVDDKTNKMEGPISSLMHKIESAFSNPK
jgi:hypothetical protein